MAQKFTSVLLKDMPSPEEWKKRTSLTFAKRSAATEKMDKAFEVFHASSTTPLDVHKSKAIVLLATMNEYLRSKGGSWAKCDRNKASKGLLERIHRDLGSALKMVTPHAAAVAKLHDIEIPHSRFGVLYLLANVSVDLSAQNYASMVVEGIGVGGSAIGNIATSGISSNDPSKLVGGNAPFSASGLKVTSNEVFMGKLGNQNVSTLITGIQKPLGIVNGIAIQGDGTGAPSQNLVSSKLLHGAHFRNAQATAVSRKLAEFWQWLHNKFNWAVDKVRSKMLADGNWAYNVSGTLIKTILTQGIGKVFAAAAPYVDAGMDILSGLARTIVVAVEKVNMLDLRKKIDIVAGHPAELARSIEADIAWGMGTGIKDMLKGTANMAAQVLLPGAGSLVSVVMAAIEWVVKMIRKLVEVTRLKNFLADARKIFEAEPRRTGEQGNRFAPALAGGIVHDKARFTEFFKKGCNASPIVPMLTLNTGICGNLMTMIRLVDDSGSLITGEQHKAGVDYFTILKLHGAKYMRDSGFSYRPYARNTDLPSLGDDGSGARDKSIQGLLNHALNGHQSVATTRSKITAMVTA